MYNCYIYIKYNYLLWFCSAIGHSWSICPVAKSHARTIAGTPPLTETRSSSVTPPNARIWPAYPFSNTRLHNICPK